jgi:hypothetical protein
MQRNKKIDSIAILILLLKSEKGGLLNSGGLLIQASIWYQDIEGIFQALGVPEHDIKPYVEDYINRIYLLKIKNTFLYFLPYFLYTLYNRPLFIFWGHTTGSIFRFFVLHVFSG